MQSRFEYRLHIKPCSCGSTDITLFEEVYDKVTFGGGICNHCNHAIALNVPKVPSMHMLLDVWNNEVYITK
jgi:hypothetical protein